MTYYLITANKIYFNNISNIQYNYRKTWYIFPNILIFLLLFFIFYFYFLIISFMYLNAIFIDLIIFLSYHTNIYSQISMHSYIISCFLMFSYRALLSWYVHCFYFKRRYYWRYFFILASSSIKVLIRDATRVHFCWNEIYVSKILSRVLNYFSRFRYNFNAPCSFPFRQYQYKGSVSAENIFSLLIYYGSHVYSLSFRLHLK